MIKHTLFFLVLSFISIQTISAANQDIETASTQPSHSNELIPESVKKQIVTNEELLKNHEMWTKNEILKPLIISRAALETAINDFSKTKSSPLMLALLQIIPFKNNIEVTHKIFSDIFKDIATARAEIARLNALRKYYETLCDDTVNQLEIVKDKFKQEEDNLNPFFKVLREKQPQYQKFLAFKEENLKRIKTVTIQFQHDINEMNQTLSYAEIKVNHWEKACTKN